MGKVTPVANVLDNATTATKTRLANQLEHQQHFEAQGTHVKYPNGSNYDSGKLLAEYGPLVRRMAVQLAGKLPACVDVNDLIQVGTLGLLDAASRYDPTHDAELWTFAALRIRGAMFDELRNQDPIPRGTRTTASAVESAVQRTQHRLGRRANDTEVAESMQLPLGDYQFLIADLYRMHLVHFSDLKSDSATDPSDFIEKIAGSDIDPLEALEERELHEQIVKLMSRLPKRELVVMQYIYEEDMPIRDIAVIMKVSDSRVCQLRAKATERLGSWLMAIVERNVN